MTGKWIRFILIAALACGSTALPSVAQIVVYEDDFSGTGGPLHGTMPDISTTGAVWEAGAGFLDDGTANNVGANGQAAHLNLALDAGKRYIAEATVLNDQADWIGFGFTVGDPADWTVNSNDLRHSNVGGAGAVWILNRNSPGNDQEGFKGSRTSGPQPWNGDVVDPTQPVDIKVVLDNTGTFSIGEFWLNGVLQSTTEFGSLVVKDFDGAGDGGEDAGGIGFSHTSDSDGLSGSLLSFRLTVVPEPATPSLLVFALISAVAWCRRR